VKKGMLVYDPFMSVGNTALACINLGVDYLSTDIDAEYTKVADEDIEKRKNKAARCELSVHKDCISL
jgi:site-specific DNA-methyltransferase (adenine-specific)